MPVHAAPLCPGAHVDQVRDVMDVVLADGCIGGCQVQQVVVAGFGALELVLRVLCLPLEGKRTWTQCQPALEWGLATLLPNAIHSQA